ncbi:hypothetical protein SprV_0100493400 [Sparganum proliferum]
MSDHDEPYDFDGDYCSSPQIFIGSPSQSDSWHDSSNQSETELLETRKDDDLKSENPTLSETFSTSVKSASSTPPPLPPRPWTLEPQIHKRPLPTLNSNTQTPPRPLPPRLCLNQDSSTESQPIVIPRRPLPNRLA